MKVKNALIYESSPGVLTKDTTTTNSCIFPAFYIVMMNIDIRSVNLLNQISRPQFTSKQLSAIHLYFFFCCEGVQYMGVEMGYTIKESLKLRALIPVLWGWEYIQRCQNSSPQGEKRILTLREEA